MYALDTDTITHYFEETNTQITSRILMCPPQDIYLPVVVVQEQVRGRLLAIDKLDYRKPQESKKIPVVYALFRRTLYEMEQFSVLDYTSEAEEIFKNIRSKVTNLAVRDCRIAAIAMANDFTVVTCNTGHFSRIPNLKVEDWSVVDRSDNDIDWDV